MHTVQYVQYRIEVHYEKIIMWQNTLEKHLLKITVEMLTTLTRIRSIETDRDRQRQIHT